LTAWIYASEFLEGCCLQHLGSGKQLPHQKRLASGKPEPAVARPIQNPPQCQLSLPQKALRPSKGNIWRSSTLTRVCSDGLPPKPICSDTSASARLRFTKWCSPSNERGWFDDNPESLAASKCWLLRSCSRSYVDLISTGQNPMQSPESGGVVSRCLVRRIQPRKATDPQRTVGNNSFSFEFRYGPLSRNKKPPEKALFVHSNFPFQEL
jgi:hypothetical protein